MTAIADTTTNGHDASALITPAPGPLLLAEHMDVGAAVQQVLAGREAIKGVVIEQDDYVDAIVRGLVAQQHTFAAGPGGVGKTFAGDKVAEVFDLSSFYTIFRNDSKREEVFGPLSMRQLQNDRYEHVMGQGFVQDSELALLDEIGDAGRFARQLLPVLNERRFVNGAQVHRIPLVSAIAMTNFWHADPVLDALLDRFVQRIIIDSDLSSDGFKRILRDGVARRADSVTGNRKAETLPKVSRDAIATVMWAVETCTVPDHIHDTVDDLRRQAASEGLVDRSPRRWSQALSLVQADAVLKGQDIVSETNLAVLRLVLPNGADEFDVAARLCSGFKDSVQVFVDSSQAVIREIEVSLTSQRDRMKAGRGPEAEDFKVLMEALQKVDPLAKSITAERKSAEAKGLSPKPIDDLATVVAELDKFVRQATGLST